jgi:hypothetical protein
VFFLFRDVIFILRFNIFADTEGDDTIFLYNFCSNVPGQVSSDGLILLLSLTHFPGTRLLHPRVPLWRVRSRCECLGRRVDAGRSRLGAYQ